MSTYIARRTGRGPRPIPLPRVGVFHLDLTRQLRPLNSVAQQFLDEGLPITDIDPLRCPAYGEDNSPVHLEQLPIWQAFRTGSPVDGVLRIEGDGRGGRLLLSTAAPLFANDGALTGLVLTAVLTPVEPDWEELAGLAHDLRSPVQTLRLLVPVLLEMPLSPAAHDLLKRLARAGERISDLGGELLEWCRSPTIGATRAALSWHVLGPLLRSVLTEQQAFALSRGTRLEWDAAAADGITMHTEPGRFNRLFTNLLTNGVRYTAAAGEVRLSAYWRSTPTGECPLVLEVSDTGMGMDDDDSAMLFQPFQRGTAGQLTPGGSGVGLAVVDRLVHELGLTLEVTSESGRGSRFAVVVPMALLRVG